MLKSFRVPVLSLPRLSDAAALRDALRLSGRLSLQTALAFVLSRAVVVNLEPVCGLAPFALALFAATLSAGLNPVPVAAGCLLGSLGKGLGSFNLSIPVGCAVVLAGTLLLNTLPAFSGWLRRAPADQARSPNDARRCMALAGLGVLLPGLVFADGEPLPSIHATAAALMALIAAPYFAETLRAVLSERRRLYADARIGACVLALALEAGICAIFLPVGLALAGLFVALLSPLAALGLGLSALLMKFPLPELAGVCLGSTLTLVVPEAWRTRMLEALRRPAEGCDPDRLAALLRADTVKRLRAMSAAFGDLAEGYLAPASMPDEQALMSELREKLCVGCPGCDEADRVLCDLVALAVEHEGALFDDGVPPELSRRCRRSRMFSETVGGLLENFAQKRRAELKRGMADRLISAQFLQAKRALEQLAAAQSAPVRMRDDLARRAVSALSREDVELAGALDMGDGLALTLREDCWTEASAERAALCLSRALGGSYVNAGMRGKILRLKRLPKLRAEVGAVSASSEPGAACGDSHLTAMLDDERLLILICDGMGTGEAAGRESAQAARLLGRFLMAGAEWSLAVETVNALLINSAAEDMFSTVDMLMIDLSSGLGECVKLSACATLIARGGEVQRIEGGRLPLGILEQVQPAASRVQLMAGDVVLMASDGVMDAIEPPALEALLISHDGEMNALSEQILDLARQGDGHRDDMTAICVKIK